MFVFLLTTHIIALTWVLENTWDRRGFSLLNLRYEQTSLLGRGFDMPVATAIQLSAHEHTLYEAVLCSLMLVSGL
jgi:hypothetical protein